MNAMERYDESVEGFSHICFGDVEEARPYLINFVITMYSRFVIAFNLNIYLRAKSLKMFPAFTVTFPFSGWRRMRRSVRAAGHCFPLMINQLIECHQQKTPWTSTYRGQLTRPRFGIKLLTANRSCHLRVTLAGQERLLGCMSLCGELFQLLQKRVLLLCAASAKRSAVVTAAVKNTLTF